MRAFKDMASAQGWHEAHEIGATRDAGVFSADMEEERAASTAQAKQDLIGGNTAQFKAMRPGDEGSSEQAER